MVLLSIYLSINIAKILCNSFARYDDMKLRIKKRFKTSSIIDFYKISNLQILWIIKYNCLKIYIKVENKMTQFQ